MPTKRTRRLRGRRAGGIPTPLAIHICASDAELVSTVRLEIRLGNPPFDKLEETEEGEKEGVEILHKLWPLCREAALPYCIEHSGPGVRPTLWWIHDCPKPGRPFVKPYNWLDPADGARFDKERGAADLAFLREHKLLSKQEEAELEPKTFGGER